MSYDGEGNITAAATTKAIILTGKVMNDTIWLWYKYSAPISCGRCAILVSTSLAEHSGIAERAMKWATFQEEAKIVETVPYGKKGRNTGLNHKVSRSSYYVPSALMLLQPGNFGLNTMGFDFKIGGRPY